MPKLQNSGYLEKLMGLVAVISMTLIGTTGVLTSTAFAADTIDVAPEELTHHLSWDGMTYSTNESSLFGDRTVVPGDKITRQVVITNNSNKRADLGMSVINTNNQGSGVSDIWDLVTLSWAAGQNGEVILSDAFDTNVINDITLEPNEVRTLTVTLNFPITQSGNANTAGTSTSEFDVEFSLAENTDPVPTPTPSPDSTPTPDSIQTGGDLPNALIVGGVLMMLVGMASLIILRARAKK